MDEVDKIIVYSLKEAGCEIEDGIESLLQFTTDLIVEATVKCLQLIKPGLEISHHLPPGMTARFRVGTTLAQACIEIGYSGEIGYQTFLYWSENDIRKVLMFLIEKLPKETGTNFDHPIGANALLNRKINKSLKEQFTAPWLSPLIRFAISNRSKRFTTAILNYPSHLEDVAYKPSRELRGYYSLYLKPVTYQLAKKHSLKCSLMESNSISVSISKNCELELNQKSFSVRITEQEYYFKKRQNLEEKFQGIFSQELQNQSVISSEYINSKEEFNRSFKIKNEMITKKDELKPDIQNLKLFTSAGQLKEEMNLQQAQQRLEVEELDYMLEKLQLDNKKLQLGISQIKEHLSKHEITHQELINIFLIKKATSDLLPDAENNLTKLSNLVEGTAQRLINLTSQWEKHRLPLIEEYRYLRELNANRLTETQKKLADIRNLREKMKVIAEEAHTKDELYQQLVSEYDKMVSDINRSVYTKRILEIVNNIKKQKQDIDKVLIDTKEVQKEINQLSGKLERTFTVTDELVFRDAKKDESIRKAYKYLAALHENCSLLVKTVEETGSIVREIRDLEDQIENESQKKLLANLERIMADYKQMKQENTQLIVKLRDRQEN